MSTPRLQHRVLVTGGFGYVGSRLTPHLLSLGHRVRVIDCMLYSNAGMDALMSDGRYVDDWSKRFEFINGDIRDPIVLDRALEGVDTVIHLAAISNDPTGEIDEILTRQVNFDAIGVMLGLAKRNGVRRFINASSSSVFGIKADHDVTESLEPEPLTYYSKYKMLSEWLVLSASSDTFCAVNIRPATICGYSPRQRFDLTVNKLAADAVRKGVITVHGGDQRRPNVGMADMVNLYGLLIDTDASLINGRTFNFGFENHKVIEIASIIRDVLTDLGVRINITSTTDNRDYHISSQEIRKTLGYQPISSIRAEVDNLRRVLESGIFPDIDAPEHYNMKVMSLPRNNSSYRYLSKT